jgi:hypothetical protein
MTRERVLEADKVPPKLKPRLPDPRKSPRLIVTLQAPTWLWATALLMAVVVNVIWWVVIL